MDNTSKTASYIPLEDAKRSIISALNEFHPELGARAAEILYNVERLNITEESSQKTGMMQCRPAGMTLDYLDDNDMYIPDFEQRFGPDFTRQDNPDNFSVIDYEYTGSPESVVYLAHELGHAIADDIQNENGRSYRDFNAQEAEEQAYFVQSIYSHYTGQSSAESLYDEHSNKGALRISWERASQYKKARTEFEKALGMHPEQRKAMMERVLGGREELNETDYTKNSHSAKVPNFTS